MCHQTNKQWVAITLYVVCPFGIQFLNLVKPCGASSKNFIFAPLFVIKIT